MWFRSRADADRDALAYGPPGLRRLKAVRGGRVFLADGNQYFNRPGPRVVETFEMIAAMLHGRKYAAPDLAGGNAAWTVLSCAGFAD